MQIVNEFLHQKVLHFGAMKSECFLGAGAPADQRPGPLLHLLLFNFLIVWLYMSLFPIPDWFIPSKLGQGHLVSHV